MAFSFRAGTNWCHDFPKLARESGFYFNMHRTHVRVDWNRISTIDIDRVIRERDFFTIDENINNVVDYHLETEYDVKILDPNFVKLFRLAQLSVEYLLYCKQYLDHSVIILKDELRSKLEENVKLKNELSISEKNLKELREKFRDKYKYLERRLSDSHGEIHKCPFCPKTFIADVFMNSHITRRHSNASQLSVTSPVHEQYRAEAEKLHEEIKTLKERLNETERVLRSESVKLCDSIDSSKDRYNDMKISELEKNENAKDTRLEEEHKKYREEINNLTTMLFSEIRSLKQDEKQPTYQNELGNENMKGLLKQQENEISQLRDRLRQLSTKKSASDMGMIQAKLNAQENYWQTKLEQLESQHRSDIEKLYTQLKLTQASTDFVKADYLQKMKELENSSINKIELPADSQPSIEEFERTTDRNGIVIPEQHQIEMHNRRIHTKGDLFSGVQANNCGKILVEDLDETLDADIIRTEVPASKFTHITVGTMDSGGNSAQIYVKGDNTRKNVLASEPRRDSSKMSSSQRDIEDHVGSYVRLKVTPSMSGAKHDVNTTINSENTVTNIRNTNKMDVFSSESDERDSTSQSTSESRSTESDRCSQPGDVDHEISSGEDTTRASNSNTQLRINWRLKSNEELKTEIQEALGQKLRDLGIDPEWRRIPNVTYRQLINTVKYHRSIKIKKYSEFEDIRKEIAKQIADGVSRYHADNRISSVYNVAKKSSPGKSITYVKSKFSKVSGPQGYHDSHTPKFKSQILSLQEKSIPNRSNMELLPKKINQIEFRGINSSTMGRSQLRESQRNGDDKALSSPIDDRYILSPNRFNTKSMESLNMKHLSHSYESIKDYMKDNSNGKLNSPLNISGPIITSTPQRNSDFILSSHKTTIASEVSSRPPNSEKTRDLLNSPKYNRSVLKSTTGSTGSLVKKKVLFDLQTIENFCDSIEPQDFYSHQGDIGDKESESDSAKSHTPLEKISKPLMSEPTNADNIVLSTCQSEKIAEISRKIETQLSTIRHKPLGGIEAMFTEGFHTKSGNRSRRHTADESISTCDNNISIVNDTTFVTKFPQPTPRTSRPILHSVSSNYKSDTKNSNLDMEIEELLRDE